MNHPHYKYKTLQLALFMALNTSFAHQAFAAETTTSTQAATQQYNIAAGELSTALQTLAGEAGIVLTFTPEQTAGKQSKGLNGRYTLEQAFDTLLVGTGLAVKKNQNNQYSLIRPTNVSISSKERTDMLPEVTVTATTKRDAITEGSGSYTTRTTAAATGLPLSIRETPQAVSVFTRQRIEDQNLVTVADILGNAAGIATLQLDSERITFSSRGFSIADIQYDGISTYYKSNYAAGESELDSIIYDRVEIVRGATGLLTGAGEPSASINLVRKRADSKEFKGTASISAGSWDNYRGTIDLSTPLTESGRVRGRIVAAYQDKHAFFERYSRESQAIYGVVDIDLTDATTLSLGASYQKSNAEGLTYGGVPLWYSDGSRTDFKRSFTVAPKWNSEDIEAKNLFANLDHRFDNDWTAQLRMMRTRNDVDNKRLFVWGVPDPDTGLISRTPSRARFPGYREQNSFDARVSGPFHLFAREHEAVIGFSYFNHEYSFNRIGASASTPWSSPLSVYDFGNVSEPVWDYSTTTLSERNHTKQKAGYAALRLSLSDPLKLTLGGRLTQYDREGAGWASSGQYSYKDHKFIPYAGLVYDLNQNYSIYASYTSIFNFQDYRDRSGAWLAPIIGKAYETGLKSELLGGRLNGSVSLFKIEQDNLAQQDTGYLVPGTSTSAYYAAQGATSKGAELELSGELASGWNAFFFATRYSAKDADNNAVNTFLPRTMLRMFTTYRLPGEWSNLTVGGGANWQSRIYYDNIGPNGEKQEQSSYLLASLMARYQFSPTLSAQINVNNLFDKEYQTAVNWYGQGIWGTPRNLQAILTYTF
ncbi:TonB-dependent alcaligin siderophore receptor FauA [Methylobacillus methanolivorans]